MSFLCLYKYDGTWCPEIVCFVSVLLWKKVQNVRLWCSKVQTKQALCLWPGLNVQVMYMRCLMKFPVIPSHGWDGWEGPFRPCFVLLTDCNLIYSIQNCVFFFLKYQNCICMCCKCLWLADCQDETEKSSFNLCITITLSNRFALTTY